MSGETQGDSYPEYEDLERNRLYDIILELERQIATGERTGISAINDYITAQVNHERELARVKPTEYFKHTQRAERLENLLKEPAYEGRARMCEEKAAIYHYSWQKKEREKWDLGAPEDNERDEKIKRERLAEAKWLRLKADCLEDETPLEDIPLREQILPQK